MSRKIEELILKREVSTPTTEVSTPKVSSQRLESEKMKHRHLIQKVSTPEDGEQRFKSEKTSVDTYG